jgi:hypothetical protein
VFKNKDDFFSNFINAVYKMLLKKMKKIFLTTAAIIFFKIFIFSQVKFSIQVGGIQSKWSGNVVSSLNSIITVTNGTVESQGKGGLTVGSNLLVSLNKKFNLETGLFYSSKGHKLKGNFEVKSANYKKTNSNFEMIAHYIDVPVLLNYEPVKGVQLYGGTQMSYLIKNNLVLEKSLLALPGSRKLDITNEFKRFDIALVGGIAYQFKNGLNIKTLYDYGLVKINKTSTQKITNQAFKITFGIYF